MRKRTLGGSSQGGAAIVEFALVALVFFTILLGIFDFGRVILYYNMMSNAAREGARVGIVRVVDGDLTTPTPVTSTMICQAAGAKVWLPGVPAISGCDPVIVDGARVFSVTAVPDPNQYDLINGRAVHQVGSRIVVTMTYLFDPVTPWIEGLIGAPITITARSSMIVER